MFSDHGKQDNSRKNSLNNENLFFLLLEEEQTLRGVQDRSYKICHFCKGHSSPKGEKFIPISKGHFVTLDIFTSNSRILKPWLTSKVTYISFKEVSMQIVQDDSKLLKRFHMIIYGHD